MDEIPDIIRQAQRVARQRAPEQTEPAELRAELPANVVDLEVMRQRLRSLAVPIARPQCSEGGDCGGTGWVRAMVNGLEAMASCECRNRAIRIIDSRQAQAAVEWAHWPDSVESPDEIRDKDEHAQAGLEWSRGWARAMHRAWRPEGISKALRPPGAIVWGIAGSGKSTLLCHLLQYLSLPTEGHPKSLGFSVCYSKATTLISALAQADFDGTLREKLASLARVDVLVIDDVGVCKLIKGRGRYFLDALDARNEAHKPLLITSNIDPAIDPALGLTWDPSEEMAMVRALDRLKTIAPTRVRYDAPESRRGK